MSARVKRRCVSATLAAVLIGTFACTPNVPSIGTPVGTPESGSDQSVAAVIASPSPVAGPPGVQIATVRRGPIAEVVASAGRVTDATEVGLSFQSAVRI